MQWNNLDLHNCADLTDVPGGVRPQRYPEPTRLALSEGGQLRALRPANVELRWVAEDFPAGVKITLASEEHTHVTTLFGDYIQEPRRMIGPEPVTFRVAPSERFVHAIDRLPTGSPFDPRVSRLMFGNGPVHLIDVKGDARPPAASQLPAKRLLAYGTSITHGTASTAPYLAYPAQLARRLGMDAINLGLGGACLCEPEAADYIAARDDWDVAVFALSVNMIGHGFSVDDFRDRVANVVHKAAAAHPQNPIFCVTIWPYFGDIDHSAQPNATAPPEQFRRALRDAVDACPTDNVHLLEGPDLLTDFAGLTTDLIHPSDLGFVEMAERLTNAIRPRLGE